MTAKRSRPAGNPRAGSRSRERRATVQAPPLPPLPESHPAFILAAAFCAAAIVLLVTNVVDDTDLWTLLAQGRALWSGLPPTVNQWTWPTWGEAQIASSWGFRALLWPLWDLGGVWGVFAWRWASTLAVFTLLWLTARRLGARGLVTFVVLVGCAVAYSARADARPETLAAVLFAGSLWIFERWRAGGGRRVWALVPIALVWANAHVSWYLLFALGSFYAGDAAVRGERARAMALLPVGLLALVACLVNPSGWRLLAAPFQFVFVWGRDPMFATIEELRPLTWSTDWANALPALLVLWPVVILARAARRRFDAAEALACVVFGAMALTSVRFGAVFAMAAAPFLARGLAEPVQRIGAALAGRIGGLAHAWPRAGIAAAACAALVLPQLVGPDRPLGFGIEMAHAPVRATDFMEATGVHGRGFNHMQHGGYLSHRFWPDRERAPFVTTQPELSSAETRAGYVEAIRRPAAWYTLDLDHRFDYLLLDRRQDPGDHLLDVLDRDTSWVMVFADDAAELYVRRSGPFADVARAHGYRVVPGGRDGRIALMGAVEGDSVLRRHAILEARRMVLASPWNGHAHRLLGYFALMDSRWADARAHFDETLRKQSDVASVRELLGFLALRAGDARTAVRLYEQERRRFGSSPRVEAGLAAARDSLRAAGPP